MSDVIVLAEVKIPLDQITQALGPEIARTLKGEERPSIRIRPIPEAVQQAVKRVVSALDYLETVTHTVGETSAREALMVAVRGLRTAHVKNRKK